jgi:hypothetical protein
MRVFVRFVAVCTTCLVGMSAASFSQIKKPNLATSEPGYVTMTKTNINAVQLPSSSIRLVLPKGVTSTKGLFVNDGNSSGAGSRAAYSHAASNSSSIRGLNTVPTFVGAFNSTAPSIDIYQSSDGYTTTSPYIMVGNNPLLGGTTTIPANITTISVQLLNPNGSVNTTVPFAPFEDLTTDSPNFLNSNYSTGYTQYGDAVQRAEFYNTMAPNWHTILNPKVVNRATIQVPATVQLVFADGTVITVPSYYTATAPDGSTVVLLLDLLFNVLDSNQVVNDINGGYFTTNAFNYHAYPNTYLFSVIDELGDTSCCTLGFHEYYFDPTTNPEARWMYVYSSWISAGIFGGGFQDVTGLSHETSETLNDPFGNNIVPTWQFPGTSGACQANLETGDPVEVLPVATVPVVTHEKNESYTYHPQTEALLQWFEIGNTSNAIGGAYSYPNTSALTATAVPCP